MKVNWNTKSTWLFWIPIDFHWLQLSLLKVYDFLEVSRKSFQFTFSLQFTLVICTWSDPYTIFKNLLGPLCTIDQQVWKLIVSLKRALLLWSREATINISFLLFGKFNDNRHYWHTTAAAAAMEHIIWKKVW